MDIALASSRGCLDLNCGACSGNVGRCTNNALRTVQNVFHKTLRKEHPKENGTNDGKAVPFAQPEETYCHFCILSMSIFERSEIPERTTW